MKKKFLLVLCAGLLTACQTIESQRINLATYSPAVDIEGEGISEAQYADDLASCRRIGQSVQAKYEEQRKKEQDQALKSAVIGALAGAALGTAIGQNNNVHSGHALTTGAIYGAALGGASGVDAIDYSRVIAKFGPTEVVDRCMARRGYYILSNEGLGGG